MKKHKLQDMVKGWFVGNFSPVALASEDFEVAIKHYRAGDREPAHVHRVATELTAIVQGRVRMLNQEFESGDIVTVEPGEATSFEALTDVITVVVKTPSLTDDKYLV